jgi:potassium efflux system protein
LGARLRGRTGVWSYRGGTILVALQRTGVALVLAAIVPGCLLLARILLGLAPVPYAVSVPLRRLLLGVAIVLFVRRVLWSLLRESGIAVRELGTPPAIAAQLLLAVRWAATVALFLVVPLTVLRARPYELEHLPRVLYTVTVLLYALLLIGLLSRKRPLLAEVLGSRGFWHQAWGFVGPMISVGLAAIVAMDVLGYRFGAGLLMGNVIQTFVVALILIGVYNVLTNFIEKAARRVFLRQRQEGAGADAYASSQEVLRRLTRFAGVTVILAAVVLLARFWGLADQLEGVFSGIHLTTVDAEKGVYLTAWNVLGALALILAGHFLLRHLPALYEALLFPRMDRSDEGSRFVIVTISRYAILLVVYAAALLHLHVSFTSLGWLLGAVTFGLAFGLQEIISNFVSGLILLLERPVRVGDLVSVGGNLGTVKQIRIRATVIENLDRQILLVPNRQFITQEVVNWTHNDEIVRSKVAVGVAYGSDVENAVRLILEVLEKHPKVLRDPEPKVLFLGFGESSLDLQLFYFTRIPDRMATLSEVHHEVNRRLEEAGITIPFPQRDLWVRTEGAAAGAIGSETVESQADDPAAGATPEAGRENS